jgi:DNA-binding NarL/FixJ family response regulator
MGSRKTKPLRLIIVDDHEVVRIGLSAVLTLAPGIKVVGQAARKNEATALSRRLKPDLVLLDIHLPDSSGIDAARDILATCPDTRVLFLTSFADDHTVVEAILAGAHGYVLKDIASDALVRAIKTVASGQALLDPRLAMYIPPWLKTGSRQSRHTRRSLLSPQEQRLLPLVAQGATNKEIADALRLREKTVKNYLANIYAKLRISRRSQVAALYAGSFKGPAILPRPGKSSAS